MSLLRDQMIQQMQLKGYSPHSIKTYIECIVSISRFYNKSPDLLSVEEIRKFFHHQLVEIKCSRSWANQCISALKILYQQVLKREWNHLDIPRPRKQSKLPQVLSPEEVREILLATTNLKHRAIFTVAYSAGLRLHELTRLKPSDIDSRRMLIKVVQGKGNKDRYTILSPLALELLREYWKKYRPKTYLFETRQGVAISDRMVGHAFHKALSRTTIKKKVGIHCLRHSFATHLMEQGVSLPIIQQLLGHRFLRTTSGYLHVQQYSVQTVRSPLERILI